VGNGVCVATSHDRTWQETWRDLLNAAHAAGRAEVLAELSSGYTGDLNDEERKLVAAGAKAEHKRIVQRLRDLEREIDESEDDEEWSEWDSATVGFVADLLEEEVT